MGNAAECCRGNSRRFSANIFHDDFWRKWPHANAGNMCFVRHKSSRLCLVLPADMSNQMNPIYSFLDILVYLIRWIQELRSPKGFRNSWFLSQHLGCIHSFDPAYVIVFVNVQLSDTMIPVCYICCEIAPACMPMACVIVWSMPQRMGL